MFYVKATSLICDINKSEFNFFSFFFFFEKEVNLTELKETLDNKEFFFFFFEKDTGHTEKWESGSNITQLTTYKNQ